MKVILIWVLAAGLGALLFAGQSPEQQHGTTVPPGAQDTQSPQLGPDATLGSASSARLPLSGPPVRVCVTMNGQAIAPAHGTVAGVWFYAEGDQGAQLLLTGHPTVPESWRMTVSLRTDDEVRLVFGAATSWQTNLQFRVERMTSEDLQCEAETQALVIKAVSGPGAARFTRFSFANVPLAFTPERRPFSREPVRPSPDLHPAIADALVEWDWRLQDGIETPRERRTYAQAMEKLLRQTDALVAERLKLKSLRPADRLAWEDLRAAGAGACDDASRGEARWLAIHRLRRQLVFDHPLFGRSPLLLVKHVPSVMSHQLTQAYGYCARPGGGLFVLPEPGQTMRIRDITPAALRAGNFMTPELSYDAERVWFAYCPVEEAPASWDFNDATQHLRYHLYELSLGSGAVRPLTQGDTDNFSPVSLPSGRIVFLSTRRGGYHRCGRGPCFVYTLAQMEADGGNPQTISFHETHEWDPSLLNDGRLIYTRWDYVDRNAVHYQQLWSARPDGSNVRIYYGNNTWNPTGLWEARAIPGTSRVMATAGPHHGMSAGSVVLLDTTQGVDGREPLTRLTPDVRFPESESPLAFGPSPTAFDFDTPVTRYWRSPLQESWAQAAATEEERRWPGHCYKSPWPLAENLFLVSYSFDSLVGEPGPNIPNMFGLYLADAFGNKELVYRDPAISSLWARPLAPRPPPPDLTPGASDPGQAHGTFFVSNVKESWPHLPAEISITDLRVVQVLLKTTPHADTPRVGAAFAAPGKQVLGTVPVEADGSAYFEVPARTPVLFQALDAQGRAVQTMRSLVYLQPGENESCIGCHEHRLKLVSPPAPALAIRRAPSKIKPAPDGSRPFSYPRLVQPVLDRHCVRCHDGQEAKRPILTGEPEGAFTKSYNALAPRVSFSAWNQSEQNFEPLTEPLRFGAWGSPLARLLAQGHGDVTLTSEELERLYTWMDANALFYGTFDVSEQRKQLAGELIEGPWE